MKNINIIFSSDNNYAKYLMVTIHSLFINHSSDTVLNIFILDGGISQENKERILSLKEQKKHNISFREIDLNRYTNLPETKNLSKATWYRILIPEIFPEMDKVLYLDLDILILKDLHTLYSKDISSYIIGATSEYTKNAFSPILDEKGKNGTYFNAGVLLINISNWRKNKITEKCFDFIKLNSLDFEKKFTCLDQDVLNSILEEKDILYISNKYNYFLLFRITTLKEKFILHYAGTIKPWGNSNFTPYRKLWFKYAKNVLTKDELLLIKQHHNFIKKIKRFFVLLIIITKNFIPKNILTLFQRIKQKLKIKIY